jgi:hypothetical protein
LLPRFPLSFVALAECFCSFVFEVSLYNPRVLPRQYLSSECRPGGKLDLSPKDDLWP